MTIANPTRAASAHEIAARIATVLQQDDTGSGPSSRSHEGIPGCYRNELTMFELDLKDWGMTYGMALALARTEDPFESLESVANRALEAATIAYRQWCNWSDRDGDAADGKHGR